MHLGRGSTRPTSSGSNSKWTDNEKCILLKVDIPTAGEIDWDYARLNLMSKEAKNGSGEKQVTASLVGSYAANTVTWNNQPAAVSGAPTSTFTIDITAGTTSGCDVTDLIKYAVEQGMTSVYIKLTRVDYFGVLIYTEGSNTDTEI